MRSIQLDRPIEYVIAALTVMGVVLVGIFNGLNQSAGLLILAAIALISVFVFTLISPNFGLGVLFFTLLLIDLIRRGVAYYTGRWSTMQLLIVDVVLVIVLVSLYAPLFIGRAKFSIPRTNPTFNILLFIYLAWIVIEIMNPTYPDLLLSLVGIRTYLSPIFAIGIGWYIIEYWNPKNWTMAYNVVFVATIVVVLFGVFTFLVNPNAFGSGLIKALLQPADHAIHTWELGYINLSSSVFASSKRFGRYLLMIYPFLWMHLENQGKHRTQLIVLMVSLVGCFVSGSREALILMIIMYALLSNWLKSIGRLLPIVVLAIFSIFLLVGPEETQRRLEFTVSTPEDWANRLEYMTISPVLSKLVSNPTAEDFLGIGAGRFGQSELLYSADLQEALDLYGNPFNAPGLTDAGLYKIFVELGVIGLVIFLVFHLYILVLPWRSTLHDPRVRASAIALVVWFALFLKAHSTLSDQIMMLPFWIYVGFIVATPKHCKQTSPTRPESAAISLQDQRVDAAPGMNK